MAFTLVVLASLVIFPFLTYYATSSTFFRRINSKTVRKKPPTIPYFVPGLFHTIGFVQLGAQKYFAELIKDYGTFAPFKVGIGLRSYVVLRDPIHVKRVLDAPEHLDATTVRIELFDKLFGSSGAAGTRKEYGTRAPGQTTCCFSDTTLASINDAYIAILSANMHDKMFQFDSWTRIEDLWSFVQLVLLRCTLMTFFGSALLKRYPRILRDYLEFDAAAEGFLYGTPRVMVSAATKSRNRLYQGIMSWLSSKPVESDHTSSAEDESVWDEHHGLRSVHKYLNGYKDLQLDNKAKAAEILSILHKTNTELIPSTFWITVEILRKSHLVRNMTTHIGQHCSPKKRKYDILGLIQVPLVQSMQTEVRRLRTATCVVRTNKTNGFPLDKHWSLPKSATAIMFSHDLSLNTDVWKKLQPRAVEKPLEEFWAERFAAPERNSKPKKNIGDETSGSTTEDLGDLVTSLTSGDQYPGPHFFSGLQMATLAVLFAEFEVQLCDTEEVDTVLPPVRKFAYGTIKPLDNIAVRIRKRKI